MLYDKSNTPSKEKQCDDEDRSIHFPHIDRGYFKNIYISDTKKEGAMKYEARK